MNSMEHFRFPDTVFNSVGRVVTMNSNHGVIEFHPNLSHAGFALFYMDNFFIDNRVISDINEVYSCLRENLHVHFNARHILFHPSLKNKTKELTKILKVLYMTTKVWVGLQPSENDHKAKLNAVDILKAILPCAFNLSITEKLNYYYDITSSDYVNLQTSLSDAVSYVVEIVNNESGVLKISTNNMFTYALFNINILYIDGMKCDSNKLLKEFISAGMKLHCNAKRMSNTFGNYIVTCVWSGRKPSPLDVFNNIIPNYTDGLKLIRNVVYVGIVLQLHPPDFALLLTSDSQCVSHVILYIGNLRLSETHEFLHKGSWIDDFLDLSDILFYKVDLKQNGVFYFASEAWLPHTLEINGYTYMVFEDMDQKKRLSWIEKEYNRITKHIVENNNVKSHKTPGPVSRKQYRRINTAMPNCAKLPPIYENDKTTKNFSSPSIKDKDIKTNLCIRQNICNDIFPFESKSDSETGSLPNFETREKSKDENSVDCGNCIKNNVSKTNSLKITEVIPLSNIRYCTKESNSKQTNDYKISVSHGKSVKLLLNKSNKRISSELNSKALSTNYEQAVLVNQQSQCNSTTQELLLNSKENHYKGIQKSSSNIKPIKKVRFNLHSSENKERNILEQNSTKINEPSCGFKYCKHNKPGNKHFTLSCGTFSSLASSKTGYLTILQNLKITFDINVLYKCGKPCDVSHKLLDHITIGQKLNYILSTLDIDKHITWGVWYGPDIPDDIIFIKSLLLLSNEKLKILANNAFYYATVVKLSPPTGALLFVQNQKQLIPVVLLAENLYCDESGHHTCMLDHLVVGDSVEVKVKKKSLCFLQGNSFYWEAAEAWKKMPYASELFKWRKMAVKGPYYLYSTVNQKKKKNNLIFKKQHNISKLDEPQNEISILENDESSSAEILDLEKIFDVHQNKTEDEVYNSAVNDKMIDKLHKPQNKISMSENEESFSVQLSDVEKTLDVHQNKTEVEVYNSAVNEKMVDNKKVDLESAVKPNDSIIVIDQMQSQPLSVPGLTNINLSENDNQSLVKVNGMVESVCCWYAIITFQYCDITERAICYRSSIALQTSSPLEQMLYVGMNVTFSIEHMKEPNMGSNYRAINVCIVSPLNKSSPVETHYNKNENSYKNQDFKSVNRYLESNHENFTYFRNQSGIVIDILSDDEGLIECEMRGICLHLRFKNDMILPQYHKGTNLYRYFRKGMEVCFDSELLNSGNVSNSNVKIRYIWKRNNLREDIYYKAKVVELRLPFAFVAQVYKEKIFVFNRNFRFEGECSLKRAANQPIKNFVCVGSEVKVLVQRNKQQTSDKYYQFTWTAKDCWLVNK